MRKFIPGTIVLLIVAFTVSAQVTADDVIDNYLEKIGGKSQLRQLRKLSYVLNGYSSGTPIQMQYETAYPNLSKLAIYSNNQEIARSEFDGRQGFNSAMGTNTPMTYEELETNKYANLFLLELYYKEHGIQMNYIGQIQNPYDYQYYHQIEKVLPNGVSSYVYYNVTTGLLAQEMMADGSYTNFSDYRNYQGFLFPHSLELIYTNGVEIQASVSTINLEKVLSQEPPSHTASNTIRNSGDKASSTTSIKTVPQNSVPNVAYTKKVALVIGNSNYKNGGSLKNPVNDAKAIGLTLKQLGFEVYTHYDLGQADMKRAIDDFGKKLRSSEVGLFYYAGHGIQSKGRNYMIPVEADLQNEQQVEYDCIAADRVLAFMDYAESKVNIVVLDACRNNPFERSWRRSANGNGLAFMNAPTGSLIAYATSPGTTASDGQGSNGLYTAALLKYMKSPGLTIEQMFKRVRSEVEEKSNKSQVPWESTSLKGEFYFVPSH
ncbi:caspase family protein [Fulvivirga sp. M361]|uniref:caspase family protein n=1 Tax=Fulvivirga sp. M361 TaxID=2594266 RepID=UPI00117AD48E|nr:caspase domain-containing protein [Fulvivirga sp. M361]TRX62526.1 caspase family protein [Fulvivirga sp. M361]